jgi:Ca2+-binding RTX toxin-like protein
MRLTAPLDRASFDLMGRGTWRLLRRLPLASLAAALLIAPSGASAVERVQDGGFEAATCDATRCTDPPWQESFATANVNGIGTICRAGTGSGDTACTSSGSAPFSGSTWARLGSGQTTATLGAGITSSLEQGVVIPAPATLSFRLRIINSMNSAGEFTVQIDGTQVFAATDSTPGFTSYAPVAIDVSAFAGSSRLLRFEGASNPSGTGPTDSYDVDEISLGEPSSVPSASAQRCKGQLATIAGTSGNDTLVGTANRDVIATLAGNDKVSGLAGKDLICGGTGKDKLKGGPGNDFLSGQKGKDTLKGGPGKDKLSGKKGKDLCVGGPGMDKAKGCETTKSI